MSIAQYIDSTLLKPDASSKDIVKLCEEAAKYKFKAVCVNSCRVPLCVELLKNSGVNVCAVAGFPLGAAGAQIKTEEAKRIIAEGADEVDMVINIGALKDGDDATVLDEIKQIKNICQNKILKVIIETGLLTNDEKIKASRLAVSAGADFVKTSTGFFGGAKVEDIALIKKTVDGRAKIKASGGIKDIKFAMDLINAGADRLGTSSAAALVSACENL